MNRLWLIRIMGIVVVVLLLALLFRLQTQLTAIAAHRPQASSSTP
jgi:hypothetical protein